MPNLTIAQLRQAASGDPSPATLDAQTESVARKTTRDGKPYLELNLADASGRIALRAWSDHPDFDAIEQLEDGTFVRVEGEFAAHPSFGLDARRWTIRPLGPEQISALLAGSSAQQEKDHADFEAIRAAVEAMADPRLQAVSALFLEEFGERFRRSAAARNYHHARRGGLVEHTAQMMRAALALCAVYPSLNRDLLLAGVLFHDCGKLWENCIEERGFGMPYSLAGELLGHIPIGIEVVNHLWRRAAADGDGWSALAPPSEEVRLHLLHLVASHHGLLEFGSPVTPKTPEAFALHHIDNLDAKLEMARSAYDQANQLAPGIYDRVRPFPGNLVAPLPPTRP